ncbi:unnamed protein product [Mytilus edulis]|uniref:Uncharacterized protein n=1 Tax=Mytilus edulis TaxID=6550 RepID=A0A8S3UAH8_MYTED|nr:unnamed protein product [Mytilus edulis]
MTTSSYNNATISSMIKPSFQQTINDNGLTKIDTSFEDFMSKDQEITILSSGVFNSMSASSTITIKGGLSEKNKTIIFISTTSAVITIIGVMLLIIFAKVYLSKYNMKPRKEGDNISWRLNPAVSSHIKCKRTTTYYTTAAYVNETSDSAVSPTQLPEVKIVSKSRCECRCSTNEQFIAHSTKSSNHNYTNTELKKSIERRVTRKYKTA